MENAGHALAKTVERFNPESVLVLSGPGNNGGDGMVAARLLQHTTDVTVCYYDSPKMTPSCRSQIAALHTCAVTLVPFRCRDTLVAAETVFSHTDLIVDALLGTGTHGNLREPLSSCVRLANESGKPIISADIPTPGINPTVICAFHRAKDQGAEVYDIGIPVLAEIGTGPGDLLLIPERDQNAHKGDGGSILIIGGGPYQGAPYLAGMAALRAGADIVRVATPVPLPFPDLIHLQVSSPRITGDDQEHLIQSCQSADVVVCGMGLGEGSHEVVRSLAPFCRKGVFDADALRNPLPQAAEDTLYTPHAGEFTRISGKNPGYGTLDRATAILQAELPGTVLLKGKTDVISDGKRVRFNQTGDPAMTTGGTGDVLAGVCGAMMVHLSSFEAACVSAYATGRAGEMVAAHTGPGLTAQDIIQVIPQILFRRIADE